MVDHVGTRNCVGKGKRIQKRTRPLKNRGNQVPSPAVFAAFLRRTHLLLVSALRIPGCHAFLIPFDDILIVSHVTLHNKGTVRQMVAVINFTQQDGKGKKMTNLV